MGKKKQTFYLQLRAEAPQLRSIKAKDAEEARKIARERFGDDEGGVKWVLGILHKNGDQIKPWENQQIKYV